MLPFMKESDTHETEPLNGNAASGNAPPADVDYLTVSDRSQNVRNTTVFVAAMFVLGLLSLGLMVKKSRPQTANAGTATAEEANIEEAISRLTGVRLEVSAGMDSILDKFYEFSNVEQVGVGELSRNPFQLEVYAEEVEEIVPEGLSDRSIVLRQRMLRDAEKLELLSIMHGGQVVRCMIDDAILQVGQRYLDFVVESILDREVHLRWEPQGVDISGNADTEWKTVLKLSE